MKKTGLGFFTILFLVFLTLKLSEVGVVKSWSWWWVTAPIWGLIPLFILAFIVGVIIAVIRSGRK